MINIQATAHPRHIQAIPPAIIHAIIHSQHARPGRTPSAGSRSVTLRHQKSAHNSDPPSAYVSGSSLFTVKFLSRFHTTTEKRQRKDREKTDKNRDQTQNSLELSQPLKFSAIHFSCCTLTFSSTLTPSIFRLPVYLSICLSITLCVYLPIYPSTHLTIFSSSSPHQS